MSRSPVASSVLPTPSPVHPATPAPGHCLNCHQRLAGAFCHHCGQAASAPARLTGHWLLHELPHAIWHVDHGVIYTVREMLLRPGASVRRYLAGERKPFFSPISLLLLVGGISAFLFTKLHVVPFDEQQPGLSPRVQQAQQEMTVALQKYQTWLSILFLPISASIATPLLRRSTGYTWVEQLVAAALQSAAFAVVGLAFIPLMAYWSGQPQVGIVAGVMTCAMIGYKVWAYADLQDTGPVAPRPVRRWLRALVIAGIDYLAILVFFAVVLAALVLIRHPK